MGADTAVIGCVGADDFGACVPDQLAAAGAVAGVPPLYVVGAARRR